MKQNHNNFDFNKNYDFDWDKQRDFDFDWDKQHDFDFGWDKNPNDCWDFPHYGCTYPYPYEYEDPFMDMGGF